MDADKVMKFIAVGLVLWAIVNALMKFMPEYATLLPVSIYEFLCHNAESWTLSNEKAHKKVIT